MANFLNFAKRFFASAILISASFACALTESTVFQWWDDGLISAEEASDLLNLLDEGNQQEVCILAEALSLETCNETKKQDHTDSPKKAKISRPSLIPHGFILWKGRTDSLGYLERSRFEIQMEFYRYRLRLGSQELLTYRNEGSEAHFGQISTKELHSYIPLDTLWGTTLLYPLGNFRISGTLDSAQNIQGKIGFAGGRNTPFGNNPSLYIFCWKSPQDASWGIQGKTPWGEFASWWTHGENWPLLKVQLHNSTSKEKIAWKVSTYIHGDSIPRLAHLSSSILGSKFWSSQTLAFSHDDSWGSKLKVNSRILINDSTTARLNLQTESGPAIFRVKASFTCLDAASDCFQDDLKLQVSHQFYDLIEPAPNTLSLQNSIGTRYTRNQGAGIPKLESGISFSQDSFNKAGMLFVIPRANPNENLQVRTQADVGTSRMQLSMAATFKHTSATNFHLIHAFFQICAFFK